LSVLLNNYNSGDQIKKNDMGGACGTHGEEENYTEVLGGGKLRGRDHVEDLDINLRIILKWIFEKWDGRYGLDLTVSG